MFSRTVFGLRCLSVARRKVECVDADERGPEELCPRDVRALVDAHAKAHPVADLAEAATLAPQGCGPLAKAFEVGVLAEAVCPAGIVVRNTDVPVETLVDSPV